MNRLNGSEDDLVYAFDDYNGSLLVEGMFNQYILLLGDFENMTLERSSENLPDPGWIWLENKLVAIYFIGSTFFTQIVILNMLIAIMSATFERHNTDLDWNAKRQKLVLQAQFVLLVSFYRKYLCCLCSKANKEEKIQRE